MDTSVPEFDAYPRTGTTSPYWWRTVAGVAAMSSLSPALAQIPAAQPFNSGPWLIFLTTVFALEAAVIVGLIIIGRRRWAGISETKKHYAELTHAGRLILAGELTASLAHEITQPLSAIVSNAETAGLLLQQGAADEQTLVEILGDIRRDSLRAGETTQHLRSLLGKREMCLQPADINELVDDTLALVRPDVVRRGIAIHTALDRKLPHVLADPIHVQQVLLNLVLNGMDAMQETIAEGRSLDVSTGPSKYGRVEVAVYDTGCGMTPEQLSRSFESFYSTKKGGMGLGLFISRSIVQAHGGEIRAEQRQSGGTVLRFTLPVCTARPTILERRGANKHSGERLDRTRH